jgi:chromosome segregation ATPase
VTPGYNGRVPPRSTTDALIRLRQADEHEALRMLQRAKEQVDRARAARDQALAVQAALTERMQRLHAASARTAGQLGRHDLYRRQLRAELATATERAQVTARALRAANQNLGAAQQKVEQALRAREAVEAQRTADDKAESRKRERRDQAASDDRWRPPKRR